MTLSELSWFQIYDNIQLVSLTESALTVTFGTETEYRTNNNTLLLLFLEAGWPGLASQQSHKWQSEVCKKHSISSVFVCKICEHIIHLSRK
jgi:hypothetical protein